MKDDFNWERAIKINLFFLKIISLWPTGGYKINFYAMYTAIVAFWPPLFLFFQGRKLLSAALTLTEFSQAIITFTITTLTALKIYTYLYNFWKIKAMSATLESDLFRPKTPQQRKLMEGDVRLWKNLYKMLFSSVCVASVLWLFSPFLTGGFRQKILPFPIHCPFDCRQSLNYFLMYQLEGFSLIIVSVGGYNIDMFMLALLTFIGAQCEILCENLARLQGETFGRRLLECVIHYNEIINFAKLCNSFSNLFLLFQFLSTIIMISFSLFQMGTIGPSEFSFSLYVMAISSTLMQMFGYCLFGERLQTKSEKILYSVFKSSWLDQDLCQKKVLLIFSLRAQSLIRISTFKLFYLSFETFLKVMKSTWSYFMVLHQLNVPE